MLELRPNCEFCDCDLPADSTAARICTYECTFCADCVEKILENVCPNCGGGFTARPIRPRHEHRPGLSLNHQPASDIRIHTNYNGDEISTFAGRLKHISPTQR